LQPHALSLPLLGDGRRRLLPQQPPPGASLQQRPPSPHQELLAPPQPLQRALWLLALEPHEQQLQQQPHAPSLHAMRPRMPLHAPPSLERLLLLPLASAPPTSRAAPVSMLLQRLLSQLR